MSRLQGGEDTSAGEFSGLIRPSSPRRGGRPRNFGVGDSFFQKSSCFSTFYQKKCVAPGNPEHLQFYHAKMNHMTGFNVHFHHGELREGSGMFQKKSTH